MKKNEDATNHRILFLYTHDLRNSMNEQNTQLYKNISIILFSKRAHSFC